MRQDHVAHEAQHVVEGQERQHFPAAVVILHDPLVGLVQGDAVQGLLTDRSAVVGEDPAGAGRAAGAHGGILAPYRGEAHGPGRVLQGFEVDLADVAGQGPGFPGNDLAAVCFVQQALDHVIRSGRVQQQGIVAGTHDAPVQGGPVVAGIHSNTDPTVLQGEGVEAGGEIIRPAGHLGIGAGQFLFALQPEGGRGFPVVTQDVEESGKGFVFFQSRAYRHRVQIAHESLLP